MNEVWKLIPGCTHYEVSNYGRVRSIKHKNTSGRILKVGRHTKGYDNVTLRINGKRKTQTVHRLMGITFLGLKPGQQINHKDGVKDNNQLSNLEICDGFENQRHRVDVLKKFRIGPLSHKHHEIIKLRNKGWTLNALARKYHTTKESIFYICKKSLLAKALSAFRETKEKV